MPRASTLHGCLLIAAAIIAALAAFALDLAGDGDYGEFMKCMHHPPISGVPREKLLRMEFHQIQAVCDCHAGRC